MKISSFFLTLATVAMLWSCNSNSNDSTEQADSTNEAVTDNAGGDSSGVAPAEEDAKFAVDAADGGMAEVKLGELAQTKATDAKVKEFAKNMVTDHTKANDELKALASSKNITLPMEPSEEKKKTETDLSEKKGADFDKAYVKQMVKDHEKTVKLFEDAQKNAKDADIKAFVDKTLPVLKTHLEHAKSLDKSK